jgi:hypothetical protein
MIGSRTRHSLAQFLTSRARRLSKYGVQHLSLSLSPGQLLFGLLNTFRELDDRVLLLVLTEIVATTGDLRATAPRLRQAADQVIRLPGLEGQGRNRHVAREGAY